ncbi:hypothetical protein ACHAXT_009937 [Thalassiosira profunda]
MSSAPSQSRLDRAIVAHEQAENEVERLCDILERATAALSKARRTKWAAQKELDEAARAAKAAASPRKANGQPQQDPRYLGVVGQSGNVRFTPSAAPARGREEQYSDEESEGEEYSDESEEEHSGDEEDDGFDIGNEALQQIRYRLEVAKIDPNSPEGTTFLDELLIRLQEAKEEVIDAALVNDFIDELLDETEDPEEPQAANGSAEKRQSQPPPPPQNPHNLPCVRINRNGKALGWYLGDLDERGYAREGRGSMYYDAGHECHGTWENDEMAGRGVYRWSDGHIYDGEWKKGKRHGLGRFVRPDNVVLYGIYVKGHHKGEGVRWSADRKEAQLVWDGVPKKTVSLARAKEIAMNLGFTDELPPPL